MEVLAVIPVFVSMVFLLLGGLLLLLKKPTGNMYLEKGFLGTIVTLIVFDENFFGTVSRFFGSVIETLFGFDVGSYNSIYDLTTAIINAIISKWSANVAFFGLSLSIYGVSETLASVEGEAVFIGLKPFAFLEVIAMISKLFVMFSAIDTFIVKPIIIFLLSLLSYIYPLLFAIAVTLWVLGHRTERLGLTLMVFLTLLIGVLMFDYMILVHGGEILSNFVTKEILGIPDFSQLPTDIPNPVLRELTKLFYSMMSELTKMIADFNASIIDFVISVVFDIVLILSVWVLWRFSNILY